MHGPGDIQFFTRFARLYDLVMPDADRTAISTGLQKAERPIDRLVDLGGGSGRATLAVKSEVSEPLVVDISIGMLSRARDRGFACALSDARRLPLPNASVDAAIIVDAFHHMPEQSMVLDECTRILRPGGVLVIREFDPSRALGWLIKTGERLFQMNSQFYKPDTLSQLVSDRGLTVSTRSDRLGYTLVGVLSTHN